MIRVRVGGAITVLNAIVPLLGSALGVDLWVEAEAEKCSEPVVHPETPLTVEALREALIISKSEGARVRVNSSVPQGWGLKSSSIVANAVILATLALYTDFRLIEVIKGTVRASRRAGVTITGAMDDAAASALGGLVMTDNGRDELLFRAPVKELGVAILLPERSKPRMTSTVDLSSYNHLRNTLRSLASLIPKDPWSVMTVNGLIYSKLLGYDDTPIHEALKAGAKAASISGTGPAVAAICDPCDEVVDRWSSLGEVILTKVNNRPAHIENRPSEQTAGSLQ